MLKMLLKFEMDMGDDEIMVIEHPLKPVTSPEGTIAEAEQAADITLMVLTLLREKGLLLEP